MFTLASPARRLVSRALEPLKNTGPDMHRRAVDYVVSGEDPQILDAIGSCPAGSGSGPASAQVTSWSSVLQDLRQEDEAPATSGTGRRDSLYSSNALTTEQWGRLGRLLEAIDQAGSQKESPALTMFPAWLSRLTADMLSCSAIAREHDPRARRVLDEPLSSASVMAAMRPGWDISRLTALLDDGGLGPEDFPAAIFLLAFAESGGARRDGFTSHPLLPVALPGVLDYLTEHARELPTELMDQLSLEERARVLACARADAPWALAGAHLVGALAVGSSKRLRKEAIDILKGLEASTCRQVLAPALATARPSHAAELEDFLLTVEGGEELLAQAAGSNKRLGDMMARKQANRAILDTDATGGSAGEGDVDSQDEELIELAPLPVIDPNAAVAEPTELRRVVEQVIRRSDSWDARADRASQSALEKLVAVAEGRKRKLPIFMRHRFGDMWWIIDCAPHLNPAHVLRLIRAHVLKPYFLAVRYCVECDIDPRVLLRLIDNLGLSDHEVDEAIDEMSAAIVSGTPPRLAWPWCAEHPELLREALDNPARITNALKILAQFPRIPAELRIPVGAIALGSSKVNRPLAQQALRTYPRAHELAEQSLTSKSQEVRSWAADWIRSLADPASMEPLRTALLKEKKPVPRAALLAALRDCGADMDEFLSPSVLSAEAAEGLKAKRAPSLRWFHMGSLPAVRWRDGSDVEPQIVQWWVTIAEKLKNPDGRGPIDVYLSLLDPCDAAVLAAHVTRAWAAQDTRHPAVEDSREHADRVGRQEHDRAQAWLRRCRQSAAQARFLKEAEEEAAVPLEARIAAAFARHQREYLGSAVASKGLLAFSVRMDGGELAAFVRAFMRDNPGRRAQFDALVHCLYAHSSNETLHVLLSIARRHKMRGIQATAGDLARAVAEERGWSDDELADRTVPTAGFDDDGLLHLSYGARELTGRLTPELKIALSDADGKTYASLPAARVGEDEELVKAAKKQLTAARKEAKAVLTLQKGRLYEAMCAGRAWKGAQWRESLAAHPLMRQLCTRLIWAVIRADDAVSTTFRLAEDGALIGVDDSTIDLPDDADVALAHGTMLGQSQCSAWREHLADYEVTPLFDQLTATAPEIEPGQKAFTDLEGHLTDTFAFRATATKRGYERGAPVDGSWFDDYVKEFTSAGLSATIRFAGSNLPEDKITCATRDLTFRSGYRTLSLSSVPPVLLAECYADYAALAALGAFDPNWENKTRLI